MVLLACLELFEAPPTLGELADALGCSHQNTKQLALKLAAKRYVRLVRDEADARRTRVVPGLPAPRCGSITAKNRKHLCKRCLRACRRQT